MEELLKQIITELRIIRWVLIAILAIIIAARALKPDYDKRIKL